MFQFLLVLLVFCLMSIAQYKEKSIDEINDEIFEDKVKTLTGDIGELNFEIESNKIDFKKLKTQINEMKMNRAIIGKKLTQLELKKIAENNYKVKEMKEWIQMMNLQSILKEKTGKNLARANKEELMKFITLY